MTQILLALVGFARAEAQIKYPPVVAWLLLGAVAYGSAWVVEGAARLMPVLSVYFRTVGVLAVLLLAHATYRGVVHRDGISWSGWLRERIK